MDTQDQPGDRALPTPLPQQDRQGAHRVAWTIGGAVLVLVTVVAFGAYRQPELLLNLLGLRYCG